VSERKGKLQLTKLEVEREGRRRQQDRARLYLALSTLTATIDPEDFVEVLADVAEINARHAVGRGQGRRARERWRRLAEVLQAGRGGLSEAGGRAA